MTTVNPKELLDPALNFESVQRGTNTLLREYEYIKATRRNRASFTDRVAEVIENRPDLHTPTDLHQLIELLCPDFSYDVVERSVEIAAYMMNICVPSIVRCDGVGRGGTGAREDPICSTQVPSDFGEGGSGLRLEFFDLCERTLRESFASFNRNNGVDGESDAVEYTPDDARVLGELFSATLHKDPEGHSHLSPSPLLVKDAIKTGFRSIQTSTWSTETFMARAYFEFVKRLVDSAATARVGDEERGGESGWETG
ncbi:hypothetical protein HK104_003296 [Borealophlyctis nickersoniae]|nr:hypothetical protein HK104_003296 [Borealophlyctis nickersoniae]